MEIASLIIWQILSIVGWVVLPGIVFCAFSFSKARWTIVDAFFAGIFCVVAVSLCAVPIVETTKELVQVTRWVTSMVAFVGALWLVLRRPFSFSGIGSWFSFLCSPGHVLIILFCIISGFLFIITHSSGYDDLAHIDYINKSISQTPFPEYRNIVDPKFSTFEQSWWIARYPYFGVLVAIISTGLKGGVFSGYYIFGLLVLAGVLVKVYELVRIEGADWRNAVTASLVSACLLVFVAFDNYLNYGIYPLLQGKLFFIAGLLFLLTSYLSKCFRGEMFVGAGLLSIAWLYHSNLVLLYAPIVLFLVLFFLVKSRSRSARLFVFCSFLFLPVLSIPSAVHPEKGFLDIRTKIVEKEVSKGIRQTFSVVPSATAAMDEEQGVEETFRQVIKTNDLVDIVFMPVRWFKLGKDVGRYFERAFSPEVFLIPLVVVLFRRLRHWTRISRLSSLISIVLVIVSMFISIPRQAIASLYRPGPALMVLHMQDIIHELDDEHVYWSDPYTAFVLEVCFDRNVSRLTRWQQKVLFYPQFQIGRKDALKNSGLDLKDHLIFNEKYWGPFPAHRWRGENGTPADKIIQAAVKWLNAGNSSELQSMVREIGVQIKKQAFGTLSVETFESAIKKMEAGASSSGCGENNDHIDYFRDTAFVSIRHLHKNELLIITVYASEENKLLLEKYTTAEKIDAGTFVDSLMRFSIKLRNNRVGTDDTGFSSSNIPLAFIEARGVKDQNKAVLIFKALDQVEQLTLLFVMKDYSSGIYRGRRTIEKMSIARRDER